MNYQLANHAHNLVLNSALEARIEQEVRALDPLVEHFPEDETLLRIVIEDGPVHQYTINLRLSLPSAVLTAHESSGDLIHAINEALAKLRRQIIEHKARLRREDEYKRKNRRK